MVTTATLESVMKQNNQRIKILIVFFVAAVIYLAFWFLQNKKTFNNETVDLEPAERLWLEKHKNELLFAPDPSYSPFEFYDKREGKTRGLAHDYIVLLQKKLGIQFKIVRVSNFNQILSLAKERKVAIVNAVTKNPERSEYLLFTEPLVVLKNIIILRQNEKREITLDDLNGKKVSVVQGYAIADFLRNNHPRIQLDLVSTDLNALLQVSSGVTSAAIIDLATATYITEKEGITNLKFVADVGYPIKLAIGSRKDLPQLNSILRKGLESISPKERKSIYMKWIHINEGSFFESKNFRFAVIMVIGLLLALSIILFWNFQLRRKVSERTIELKKAKDAAEDASAFKGRTIFDLEKIKADLEKKSLDLKQAIQSRDEMVGVISHELKNPLANMLLTSSLIQKILPKDTSLDKVRSLVEKIDPSVQRMNQLLLDLLDITRVESSALKVESKPSELAKIVQDVIGQHKTSAQEKNIQLSTDIHTALPNVFCDPARTMQILSNLVNNSIKFTSSGGSITIHAEKLEHEIEIRVTDTGNGISEEDLPHVFDRFWQKKDTAYIGTGLGLAIVKGLVDAQGGKIWVKSRPGIGTTFYFTLLLA